MIGLDVLFKLELLIGLISSDLVSKSSSFDSKYRLNGLKFDAFLFY